MRRYYFHVSDGTTKLDHMGEEFPDIEAVQHNAFLMTTDLMRGSDVGRSFWSGEPWRLWVTDGPDGAGTLVLELNLTASTGSRQPGSSSLK